MNAATDRMSRDRLAQERTTNFINCFIVSVPASVGHGADLATPRHRRPMTASAGDIGRRRSWDSAGGPCLALSYAEDVSIPAVLMPRCFHRTECTWAAGQRTRGTVPSKILIRPRALVKSIVFWWRRPTLARGPGGHVAPLTACPFVRRRHSWRVPTWAQSDGGGLRRLKRARPPRMVVDAALTWGLEKVVRCAHERGIQHYDCAVDRRIT